MHNLKFNHKTSCEYLIHQMDRELHSIAREKSFDEQIHVEDSIISAIKSKSTAITSLIRQEKDKIK